jgi:hypothetical protein
VAGKEIAVKK